jgi:hypothetical protein
MFEKTLEKIMATMINLQFEQKQAVLSFPQEFLAMDFRVVV